MVPDFPGSISQTIGTAQRAGEVVTALTRFGFGEFLIQTGLGGHFKAKPDKGSNADDKVAKAPLPQRVRMLLEALGPTFIKAGQILSTRPDLVPPEWAQEFRNLQSDVPAGPWDGEDGIKSVIESELGPLLETEFAHIDEKPIAAASMAQVHRAVLTNGERVVLKVLRPGIREEMASDIDLMRLLGRLTKNHFENIGIDPQAVIDEFARQLERETDLRVEAKSTERMRRDFEGNPGVHFAKVYSDLSTRSVLCMEEVKGTLLARLDVETLTTEQRETIIRNGADAVFKQCLIIGFFHADPHPGNIFVLDDQSVCFIDCGMTGLIDPGTISDLAQITHGAVSSDLNRVIKTAIHISNADPAIADNRTFRAEVWQFLDHFHSGSLGDVRMGVMLNDFFAILRKHRLRCPADIVYLIKALTTIEGVAEEIAPDFDLVSYVRPYVEQLVKHRYSFDGIKTRFESAAMAYSDLLSELPDDISTLMTNLRQNRLSLNLDHRGLDKVTDEIERASMNISWSLVLASVIVGGAVLVLVDNIDRDASYLSVVATAAVFGAIFIGLFRLIRLRFTKK